MQANIYYTGSHIKLYNDSLNLPTDFASSPISRRKLLEDHPYHDSTITLSEINIAPENWWLEDNFACQRVSNFRGDAKLQVGNCES